MALPPYATPSEKFGYWTLRVFSGLVLFPLIGFALALKLRK